jgi:hypothetical protein
MFVTFKVRGVAVMHRFIGHLALSLFFSASLSAVADSPPLVAHSIDVGQGATTLDVDLYPTGHQNSHNGTAEILMEARAPRIAGINIGRSDGEERRPTSYTVAQLDEPPLRGSDPTSRVSADTQVAEQEPRNDNATEKSADEKVLVDASEIPPNKTAKYVPIWKREEAFLILTILLAIIFIILCAKLLPQEWANMFGRLFLGDSVPPWIVPTEDDAMDVRRFKSEQLKEWHRQQLDWMLYRFAIIVLFSIVLILWLAPTGGDAITWAVSSGTPIITLILGYLTGKVRSRDGNGGGTPPPTGDTTEHEN